MGLLKRPNNAASCGGIIRDCLGNFINAFTHHIGFCLELVGELWGLLNGLQLASRMGLNNIILEADSAVAVSLI